MVKIQWYHRKYQNDGAPLSHEAPITPWTQPALDQFTFDNHSYLVVDYTLKFPIV